MMGKSGVKCLIAATVLCSASLHAADNQFYIRADLSSVTSSQEESDFAAALVDANYQFQVDRYDENRSGYQISFGYQWDKHLFTEIGYLDLGEVKVDLTLAGNTNLNDFTWHFDQQYPLTAEGITLVQGLLLNPDSALKISAEIGVYFWRRDVDVINDVLVISKNDGEDPLVGVKFELPLSEKIGIGLGIRRIYFDEQEADLISLTGSFYF